MGNNFTITVVAQNEKTGNENINMAIEEIRRIEKLLTTYKDDSQTKLINNNAGIKAVKGTDDRRCGCVLQIHNCRGDRL